MRIMEEELLRKAREEADKKLKALRESNDKQNVKAEEENVLRKLREKKRRPVMMLDKKLKKEGFFHGHKVTYDLGCRSKNYSLMHRGLD